jgi:copper(I)-binding protein
VIAVAARRTPYHIAPLNAALRFAAAGVLALGALAGCGTGTATTGPSPTSSAGVTVVDAWVKTAGSGMTAAFGTIVNSTDADVTVVSAASSISSMMELHEVVQIDGAPVMRPKRGGIVVPAHGRHALTPGGDHIMIMNLARPLTPGTEVAITLTFTDGKTLALTAVAKEYAGAKESYAPTMGPMAGMSPTAGVG